MHIYIYYVYGVAQILFYNIQGLNPNDNNKCNNMNRYNYCDNNIVCKNSPHDVDVDRTVSIQDDSAVNFVVNDVVPNNNRDMNPNTDDNV